MVSENAENRLKGNKTMQRVRVRDLPNGKGAIGTPDPQMLYCYRCGGEYSNTPGDYFLRSPDTVLRCACHSKAYLRLVIKEVHHIPA